MTLEGECLVVVTPRFCGVNHKTVLDELERECLRVRAMETQEAPANGKFGRGRPKPNSCDENKTVTPNSRGNSSEYRISRLKRDFSEVAKRVEAGEFTQAILDETGKTPKAWYEEKLRPAHTKIAMDQANPESREYVSPKGGRPKNGETRSNTTSYSSSNAEQHSKPGILRRLARERPDLLDRFERGELTANAAAIEAGFRKPPKPRPTTPLELLDYCGEVLKTDSRIDQTNQHLYNVIMLLKPGMSHEKAA